VPTAFLIIGGVIGFLSLFGIALMFDKKEIQYDEETQRLVNEIKEDFDQKKLALLNKNKLIIFLIII
jgi:hypothetical protein